MFRGHRPTNRPGRAGFTLLELLLVLAILTVMAGLVWPALKRQLDDNALKSAGQSVRHTLAKARLNAIESSRIYQVRFEPNGRWFLVLPFEPEDATVHGGSGGLAAEMPLEGEVLWKRLGQLPEQLEFNYFSADVPTEQIPQDWVAEFPEAHRLSQTRWSAPLLFFPDGSAEDAFLTITDVNRRYIGVGIRGLTGGVRVTAPQWEEVR